VAEGSASLHHPAPGMLPGNPRSIRFSSCDVCEVLPFTLLSLVCVCWCVVNETVVAPGFRPGVDPGSRGSYGDSEPCL